MAYDWKKLHVTPGDVSRGATQDTRTRLDNISANNSLALDVEALRKKLDQERKFVDQKKWAASPGVQEKFDPELFEALLAQMASDDVAVAKIDYDKRRPDAAEYDRIKYGENSGVGKPKSMNPFDIITSQLPRAAADLNPANDFTPEAKSFAGDTLMAAVTGGFMNGPAGLASALATYSPDVDAAVKMGGGNWLESLARHGSVGKRLGTLKRQPDAANLVKQMEERLAARPDLLPGNSTYGAFADSIADMRPHMAVNDWIDGPLQKYIKNQMATPNDPVRLGIESFPQKKAAMVADAQARLDAMNNKTQQLMDRKGLPEHALVRHRQDVLAAERNLREVSQREGIHFQPEGLYGMRGEAAAQANRRKGGFPEGEVSTTDLGKRWERVADASIYPEEMGDLVSRLRTFGTDIEPWMVDKPKSDLVHEYDPRGGNQVLGFDHLIDELYNSIRPADPGGIPDHLRLDPKNLGKIAVPQMIENVDKINAWRGANKIEANAAKANNAATHMYKEYPDDPDGLKWMQFKQREGLPEGWKAFDDPMSTNYPYQDNSGVWRKKDEHPHYKELEDALQYEGDAMQHCVGGYCKDVADGRTQIFSLRDAKGQPHTTIEAIPGKKLTESDSPDTIRDQLADMDAPQAEFEAYVQKYLADREIPPRIKQVKGVKNGPPDEKYLPMIQDFIRSGNWGDVGDLEHTGLHLRSSLPEAERDAQQYYNRVSRYDPSQLTDIDLGFIKDWKEGNFAAGGQVKADTTSLTDDQINGIMAQLNGIR